MLSSCSRHSEEWARLDAADALMEEWPDSALTILAAIDTDSLRPGHETARHALLLSMALDKNMMDIDSFAYLQPAIDYYADHGTPDERLRTLYYTGCIHANRGENDLALQCFIQGKDLRDDITDSLTYARLLVYEGLMYNRSYNAEKIAPAQIEAAHIYRVKHNAPLEFKAWIRALEGAIILEDSILADSIRHVCDSIIADHPELEPGFLEIKVTYLTYCAPPDSALQGFDEIMANSELNEETKLNLALGYTLLGQPQRGIEIFNNVDSAALNFPDGSKYLSVKVGVLEATGDWRGALNAYKAFNDIAGVTQMELLNKDFYFAQEHHNTQLARDRARERSQKMLWICILSGMLFLAILAAIYYKWRAKAIERKSEVAQLEAVIHNLEDQRSELIRISESGSDIIKERINFLNKILACKILEKRNSEETLADFIKDRAAFVNSTRLAYADSHPRFIKKLVDAGLTEHEINLASLYALGLRGKEISIFTGDINVYRASTAIREKLGIPKDGPNLGKYFQQLLKEA